MLFARTGLPCLPAPVKSGTEEMEKTAHVNITFISLFRFICEVKTLRSSCLHLTANGKPRSAVSGFSHQFKAVESRVVARGCHIYFHLITSILLAEK